VGQRRRGRAGARVRAAPRSPAVEAEEWTDVDYVMAKAEFDLSRTFYAGDALPMHNPWLGPDQFAAWLGADISFAPRDNTSWVKPFVEDWSDHPRLAIDPDNGWWKLYLDIVRPRPEREGQMGDRLPRPPLGPGRTGRHPRFRTAHARSHRQPRDGQGQDAADDGPLADIVDRVAEIVMPAGQGSSNWTAAGAPDASLPRAE